MKYEAPNIKFQSATLISKLLTFHQCSVEAVDLTRMTSHRLWQRYCPQQLVLDGFVVISPMS